MNLDAAYLRLARARQHLRELAVLCDDVSNDYCERLRRHYPERLDNVRDLLALFDTVHPEERIPPTIAVRIGEVIYNLRASLDYLVCTLAKTDTPVWVGNRRNQFPIERTQRGFLWRRQTFLAGLTDDHVREIERYQPYKGCQWTERLARLSNLDKHNDLVVVEQGLHIRVEPSDGTNPHCAHIAPHLSLGFRDGPVVRALDEIGTEVSFVLDRFVRR
jgi:hypothetical protein